MDKNEITVPWILYFGLLFFLLLAYAYNTLRVRYEFQNRAYIHGHAFRYLTLAALMAIAGLAVYVWSYEQSENRLNVTHNAEASIVGSLQRAEKIVGAAGALTHTIKEANQVARERNEILDGRNGILGQGVGVLEQAGETHKKIVEFEKIKNELLQSLVAGILQLHEPNENPPEPESPEVPMSMAELKNKLEGLNPLFYNSPGWHHILEITLENHYDVKFLFSSPSFSSDEPYLYCDCTKELCGLPEIRPRIYSSNKETLIAHRDQSMFIIVGRHDVRPHEDNEQLAQRRAQCIVDRYAIPQEQTAIINAPYRQVSSSGNVKEDRRAEVYVVREK